MRNSKRAIENSKRGIEISKAISIGQMMVGVFFLFIFGLSTVACLRLPKISNNPTVDRVFFAICLIFDALGVVLIIFSIKRRKRIKKLNQETNYFIIGSGTKNQQGAARPQINTAQPQTNTGQPQTNTAQSQSAPRAQKIQVICECCGGINKIEKGIVSECDFCGSPING